MGSVGYQRRRPEHTLLYQIVERHYPAFTGHLAEAGKQLPGHVRQAFDGYLQCGRLDHGFLRLRCDACRAEHLLIMAFGQTDQISNRSALICWIGEQLLDPAIDDNDNLCQVMCERLALILVDLYPHRWAEIVVDVVRNDPLPSFAFLDAMRRLVAESRT